MSSDVEITGYEEPVIEHTKFSPIASGAPQLTELIHCVLSYLQYCI